MNLWIYLFSAKLDKFKIIEITTDIQYKPFVLFYYYLVAVLYPSQFP